MIDEIYFFGNKVLSEDFLKKIDDFSVLVTPEKSKIIDLSSNTVQTGKELMNLFKKYDIIYLDVRNIEVSDLGMGILQCLGYKFFDACEDEIEPKGTNLYHIHTIECDCFLAKNKKLRLIMTRPRENCANIACGRIYKTSPFEGELLIRSLHNVLVRLEDSGYSTSADLKAFDSGGISTVLASLLRDEGLKYIFDSGINPDEFGEDIYYEIYGGKNGKSRLQS